MGVFLLVKTNGRRPSPSVSTMEPPTYIHTTRYSGVASIRHVVFLQTRKLTRIMIPIKTFLIQNPYDSVVTRAILFGSNMHQIVQWQGFAPDPSSQRSPDQLAGKQEGKGGEEMEEEGGEGRGWRAGCLLLNLSLAIRPYTRTIFL